MSHTINRRVFVKHAALGAFAVGFSPSLFAKGATIERDVCILGAGASGMFTADRLRELGYSVVMLEKTNRVGGHAQTYRKAGASGHLDMGVRIYPDKPLIKDMLEKYGVDYTNFSLRGRSAVKLFDYEDYAVSPAKMPAGINIYRSMLRYEKVYEKQFAFLQSPGLTMPDDISEEVFLPFGEFLTRHRLHKHFMPMINYLQGFGKVAEVPTFYALKNLRPAITRSARKDTFIAPVNGVDQMYREMANTFAQDVIKDVSAYHIVRKPEGGAEIRLQRPEGTSVIKAKHVFVTFPPVMKNMEAFDLNAEEKRMMGKFKHNHYRTIAMEVEGLPDKMALMNAGKEGFLTAMNERGIYLTASSSIEGTYNVLHGTDDAHALTDEEAQDEIIRIVEGLKTFYQRKVTVKDIGLFLNHSPYMVHVAPEDIRDGFYNQMDAMQGKRSTYYVGAAFSTHGTFATWQQAETIIDRFFTKKKITR